MLTTIIHTDETAFLHSIIADVNTHFAACIHSTAQFFVKKVEFSTNRRKMGLFKSINSAF